MSEVKESNDFEKFEDFQKSLRYYLNEATNDISESSESEEMLEADKPMLEVFRVLNRDIVNNAFVITKLYEVCRESIE